MVRNFFKTHLRKLFKFFVVLKSWSYQEIETWIRPWIRTWILWTRIHTSGSVIVILSMKLFSDNKHLLTDHLNIDNQYIVIVVVVVMVLVLDGNSKIGAHVRGKLYYFICLRHLIRSREVINRIFPRHIFLYVLCYY